MTSPQRLTRWAFWGALLAALASFVAMMATLPLERWEWFHRLFRASILCATIALLVVILGAWER